MTDLELANDWLTHTFKDTPLHPQVGKDLEALLARIRLDEAELFLVNHKNKSWTGQHMMKLRRQAGIKHLEQAAGVGKK